MILGAPQRYGSSGPDSLASAKPAGSWSRTLGGRSSPDFRTPPRAAFEGLQAALAANRSEFYRAVPAGPFYNFDQPGVEPSEAVIANWWRQGMMGGAKGQYECVSEFIREDYSEDLKKITVPVLAMNGDGDQVVPHDTSGPRAVKLVQNGTLKTYPGFPHGMLTTHADVLNPDILAFIQS
jgi:non-heme chloroperoxidase